MYNKGKTKHFPSNLQEQLVLVTNEIIWKKILWGMPFVVKACPVTGCMVRQNQLATVPVPYHLLIFFRQARVGKIQKEKQETNSLDPAIQ